MFLLCAELEPNRTGAGSGSYELEPTILNGVGAGAGSGTGLEPEREIERELDLFESAALVVLGVCFITLKTIFGHFSHFTTLFSYLGGPFDEFLFTF